jgi:hypothetical protein
MLTRRTVTLSRPLTLGLFATAVFAAVGVCRAAPAEFPIADGGTGHTYEVVLDPAATYAAANTAAAATGGHLVTITSPAEQQFVEDLLVNMGSPTGSYWIGLERQGAGIDFGWSTGEPLTYSNFAAGEPNDYVQHEDFVTIYWAADEADDMHDRTGRWNDAPMPGYPDGNFAGEPTPDLGRAGFIVERLDVGSGGNPPPTAIPLPPAAVAAPLAFGLAGLAARRARRAAAV